MIIFWESLTGQQFNIPVLPSRPFPVCHGMGRKEDHPHAHDSSSSHPFNHIYAMFRHDRIAINLQTRPGLSSVTSLNDDSNMDSRACFDLSDSKYWACFSNPEHAILKHPGSTLLPSLIAQGGNGNAEQSASLTPSFMLQPEPLLRERFKYFTYKTNMYVYALMQCSHSIMYVCM